MAGERGRNDETSGKSGEQNQTKGKASTAPFLSQICRGLLLQEIQNVANRKGVRREATAGWHQRGRRQPGDSAGPHATDCPAHGHTNRGDINGMDVPRPHPTGRTGPFSTSWRALPDKARTRWSKGWTRSPIGMCCGTFFYGVSWWVCVGWFVHCVVRAAVVPHPSNTTAAAKRSDQRLETFFLRDSFATVLHIRALLLKRPCG